jgi:hypothetical protein
MPLVLVPPGPGPWHPHSPHGSPGSTQSHHSARESPVRVQAMRNWSACMARNGFSSSDADTFSAGPHHPGAEAGPGAEPFRPARRADLRAEPGADRDGHGRRELHAEQRPVRDLLRRPGKLRAAVRQRKPAGTQRRGPAVQGRLRPGAQDDARPAPGGIGRTQPARAGPASMAGTATRPSPRPVTP